MRFINEQVNEVRREFAKYGFISCPLYHDEIQTLLDAGLDNDAIWGIGCDVAAGISFHRAYAITKEIYENA